MSVTIPQEVVGKLREIIGKYKDSTIFKDIVEPRDSVFARYQPVFSPENLLKISSEEFQSFLILDNNKHWSGLHRMGPRICSDMDKLRAALAILTDETKDIKMRLNESIDMVSGIGKNIATAILLITNPEKYGVWNNRSEGSMKRLRIWPDFDRGESFGSRYVKVNQILLQLKEDLGVDLWVLDALWYCLDQDQTDTKGDIKEIGTCDDPISGNHRFGLERHLHEFLRDNWRHIELGKEWNLYQEPGDEEAGYEYPCEVGRIDILAKHKKESRWLVLELKRNQTSDQTVGQILRYIGWVKTNLAQENEQVEGLIICRESDKALHYALSAIPNVQLRHYQVEFHLKEPEKMPEGRAGEISDK